ncbi:hypothetical protein QFZ23_000180 [Arthrobacter globiformis]|uniref:DUF1801 domain-containing protein n=1 Tax=Arthrobacter globiformis TaxID=1665 RepID=UPI002787511F|nr:hypothetical protein [Arthrobacter globiformis]
MADNKTQVTGVSADDYIAALEHPVRRQDGVGLRALLAELTGQEPEMWGPTIVGFGRVHYKYATGREGDTAAVGFSPRKASLSLYGLTNAPESAALLAAWESTRRAPAASTSTSWPTSMKPCWPS